ncbi:MAG TPA: hypothetical protein VEZ90_00410, partial [Blastocatellia bacterium]|nr:hypothetical protein [Blastocatellia bacterium]
MPPAKPDTPLVIDNTITTSYPRQARQFIGRIRMSFQACRTPSNLKVSATIRRLSASFNAVSDLRQRHRRRRYLDEVADEKTELPRVQAELRERDVCEG